MFKKRGEIMFTKELHALEQTLLNFGGAAAQSNQGDSALATRLSTAVHGVASNVVSAASNTASYFSNKASNAFSNLVSDATEATSRLVDDASKAATRLATDATQSATNLMSEATEAASRFAAKTATDAAADAARIVANTATEAVLGRVKTIFNPEEKAGTPMAASASKWNKFYQAGTVMTGPIGLTLFSVEQFFKFALYGVKALVSLASSDHASAEKHFETAVLSFVNVLTGLLLAVLSPVLNIANLLNESKNSTANDTDEKKEGKAEEAAEVVVEEETPAVKMV